MKILYAQEAQMIEEQTATVYYAPTKGRRYLTKKGALNGEATAIILEHYPSEPHDPECGGGWDIRYDHPKSFEQMRDRLIELLKLGDLNHTWKIHEDDLD